MNQKKKSDKEKVNNYFEKEELKSEYLFLCQELNSMREELYQLPRHILTLFIVSIVFFSISYFYGEFTLYLLILLALGFPTAATILFLIIIFTRILITKIRIKLVLNKLLHKIGESSINGSDNIE